MSLILAFLAVIILIAFAWLWRQGILAKPWLETGVVGRFPAADPSGARVAKVGLAVFLAVVGSLFALTISAYLMRASLGDWEAVRMPGILWINTGVLALSSLSLETARLAAGRDDADGVRAGVLAAGATAALFVIGQLIAWRQLEIEGYYLATNPANAFFYLITALHGLHVLGGLAALGRVTWRMQRGAGVAQLRLGVELCATYWHALLLIWLVLLGLLANWLGDFVAICRQLLT
ncbi:MAG: cytochrome c oxidase subunit 3 [Rhizobiales bacterium]|nr:cytochrome c oxidase subunit 3 [Hyphomicrobiales bacterium]